MNPALAAIQKRRSAQLSTKIIEKDGRMFYGRSQDCTSIAEFTKAQHNAGNFGSSEIRHAAKIPSIIIEQYCNDHHLLFSEVIGNPEHMRRICNDPKNAMFRIWKGKV